MTGVFPTFGRDRLLHAALIAGEVDETDFTQGPAVFVSMVWLAVLDCVEVSAYDATKPTTHPPFYSETVEKVKDAEELWKSVVGSGVAWGRPA